MREWECQVVAFSEITSHTKRALPALLLSSGVLAFTFLVPTLLLINFRLQGPLVPSAGLAKVFVWQVFGRENGENIWNMRFQYGLIMFNRC